MYVNLPFFIIGTVYEICRGMAGGVTTSLGSIACLQAQVGFAPQVFDHMCGLRNAWKDGSWKGEMDVGEEEGCEGLA